METGDEGALAYLRSVAARQQPFFMVISLVNPHDVLFYPKTYIDAGYDDSWLEGDIELPATVDEDLSTKPSVQEQFRNLFALTGVLLDAGEEAELPELLRQPDEGVGPVPGGRARHAGRHGAADDTVVIRTADHGEMGMAHGGLRQKNFNFYEESLRVPLVYSNPGSTRGAQLRRARLARRLPADAREPVRRAGERPRRLAGGGLLRVVLHPAAAAPQDYVVFTFDDWQAGQANAALRAAPNHIVSIREERWKLAKYYDADGKVPSQWEMYDLECDPLERPTWPGRATRARRSRSSTSAASSASSPPSRRRGSRRSPPPWKRRPRRIDTGSLARLRSEDCLRITGSGKRMVSRRAAEEQRSREPPGFSLLLCCSA
jgi:choline-sulfatase